jgi:hypothetical protein
MQVLAIQPEDAMKTYRIEFVDGLFSSLVMLLFITVLSLTIVGLPIAIAMLPTLYRIVEESDT